jgi:hypothetical protein
MGGHPPQQPVRDKPPEVTVKTCNNHRPSAGKRLGCASCTRTASISGGEQRFAVGNNPRGANATLHSQHKPMCFGGGSGEDRWGQQGLSIRQKGTVIADDNDGSGGNGQLGPFPINDRPVDEPPHVAARDIRGRGKPSELRNGRARWGNNAHNQ